MKPRKPFLLIRFTNGSDEQRRFHGCSRDTTCRIPAGASHRST
jgi:hypothetical protein